MAWTAQRRRRDLKCEAAENSGMEATTANRPYMAGHSRLTSSYFQQHLLSQPATLRLQFPFPIHILPPASHSLPPHLYIPRPRPPSSSVLSTSTPPHQSPPLRMSQRNNPSPVGRSDSLSPYPSMSRRAPAQPKSTRQQYSGALPPSPHPTRPIHRPLSVPPACGACRMRRCASLFAISRFPPYAHMTGSSAISRTYPHLLPVYTLPARTAANAV